MNLYNLVIHSWGPLLYRSDQHFAINASAVNNISDARPIFDSLDWTEENYRMLERTAQTGQQQQICFSATGVSKHTYIYSLHIKKAMYKLTSYIIVQPLKLGVLLLLE